MADYASNCPVSWPIKLPDVIPEVDLNGVMFSYRWGLCFTPTEQFIPMRPPTTVP